MKVIKFRKKVVLDRILLAIIMMSCSILLFFSGSYSNPDALLFQRVAIILISIFLFLFFSWILLLFIYVLFKNPTMFYFDENKIIVKNREIDRKNIVRVGISKVPTGILGTKTDAFTLHCKDKEIVYIQTYNVLTKKERANISYILKQYVSNYKNKEIFK